MTGPAVVIVGAGATGLTLAGELALAGIEVTVVERRPNQDVVGQRALGFSSRTIEVFDQRGIADRFLSQGKLAQINGFGQIRLDISDFPTRHNYGLALPQQRIESILADWVGELGVPIRREVEVTGFTQDETGVDVDLSEGGPLRAQYLVGCDGGRSLVRKTAGIAFPGWEASTSSLIAEVELDEEPVWGIRRLGAGVQALSRPQPGGPVRVLVTEPYAGQSGEPTLRDLSEALMGVFGTDYGLRSATWISRFTDMARQAAAYRNRRVLLAGDAAHVHAPIGGQGLGVGVQDAVNLGWKLAQEVRGTAPEGLLDTYHTERHPVAARVLQNTMAQGALTGTGDRLEALRDIMAGLLSLDEPRKQIAGMMSGLDIHYDLGAGHPLLGRRMPDLDLVTPDGPLRVFTLLHAARPVLLNLGEPGTLPIAPWSDRVRSVDAAYAGPWELPVLGPVPAPEAVLIRPDGYVAWVGGPSRTGLADALTRWFGPPSAADEDAQAAASLRTISS
ncbi:FAD-dependent monooxygenase [Catenulispora subtropica]|uniref:FAD-dependent monooxygenase n=1 Tax=Catenulispora subtropica TaxID=450798 RepID=A0ABN2RIB4_9ACTN